jgi:hypothetical protein
MVIFCPNVLIPKYDHCPVLQNDMAFARQLPHRHRLNRRRSGWRATTAPPEGRCIPRFQVYRLSALTGRLRVWRSVRCDPPPQSLRRDRPPGLTLVQHAAVEDVSRSFHPLREPQQSTRSGPPYDKSCSRSKDGACLMRLPSVRGGALPLTAARLFVKLTSCFLRESRGGQHSFILTISAQQICARGYIGG